MVRYEGFIEDIDQLVIVIVQYRSAVDCDYSTRLGVARREQDNNNNQLSPQTSDLSPLTIRQDASLLLYLWQRLRHEEHLHPHPELYQEVGGRAEEVTQGKTGLAGLSLISVFSAPEPETAPTRRPRQPR